MDGLMHGLMDGRYTLRRSMRSSDNKDLNDPTKSLRNPEMISTLKVMTGSGGRDENEAHH